MRWGLAVVMSLSLMVSSASAHLMSSGHGTLNVVDGKAYIVISLPIAAFAKSGAAAAMQDGVLTSAELKTHDATLRAAVRAGLQVKAGAQAAPFSSILLNLPKGADHTPGQGTELVMMIVAPLASDHETVAVSSTLWAKGADSLKLRATVTEGRRTTQTETHVLTTDAPAHVFFAKTTSKRRKQGHPKPHSH